MAESTETKSIFTSYQVERLQDISRFIIRVCDNDIVVAVMKLGFDAAELAEGQKEYAIAAGLNVSLNQHISSAMFDRVQAGGATTKAKVRKVDEFENRWYPRVRNALRRYVAADQCDAFVEAFFRDMPQQPEGPLAVDSVRKLLPRVSELATSTVPGAKQAHDSLLKKGLQVEIDYVTQLLKDLEAQPAIHAPTPPVSAADIDKLAADRLAAYERLNLWYTDWSQVFRDELGYHQLVRLGLVAVGSSASGTPESPAEPTPSTP